MSGGVRNLRAMFENKDTSADPPDRGRSPAGSTGGASNGTSPRPLSKVRTSFVTVERSGQLGSQLGLKRETSGEPSLSKRRTSFSIDEGEHPKETAERKQSLATEVGLRKNSSVIEETIPEAVVETPTMTPTIEANKKLETSSRKKEVAKPAKGEEKKASGPSQGHTNGTTKAPVKHVEKPSASKTVSKPAPISTAKTATAAKPSPKKSPVKTPKTPTTPGRSHIKEAPAKTPERKPEKVDHKPEKKDTRSSLAPSHAKKPASKPATTAAHGSAPKTRIPPSPPQTGFVKPRPRSPTRPIKLPASLTAHTASSGSKTAAAAPPASRQSLSRASGNAQPSNSLQAHHALARSPSRASATTTTKSTLTRKPSTLKNTNPRPSLGPPPATLKKQTSRTSLPSHTAPADEGLLARMMRPTASSSSKTADKLDVTPPKISQSVKRPVTRDGPAKHTTTHGSPAHKVKETSHAKAVTKDAKPVVKKENASVAPVEKKEEPKIAAKEPAAVEAEAPEAAEPAVEAETTEAEEGHDEQVEDVKDVEVEPEALKPEEPVIAEEVKEELAEEAAAAAEVEEAAPIVEEPVSATEPVKEEAPEISEPAPAEDIKVTAPAIEEPEPSKEEPIISEPIPSPKDTKPEEVEDPEDVKAREEIAKLNAEVLRAAAEDDDVE